MTRETFAEAITQLDGELLERYFAIKADLNKPKKAIGRAWVKWAAAAACFALMTGGVLTLPGWREEAPLESTASDCSESSEISGPTEIPTWEEPRYTALEIADLFAVQDNFGTNQYQRIYVPDSKDLPLVAPGGEDYLGVYRYAQKGIPLDKNELSAFLDSVLPSLTDSLDITLPPYEIRESERYGGRERVYEYLEFGEHSRYRLKFVQSETLISVGLSDYWDKQGIVLDGEIIQADQRLTDEEILDSLQSVKNKLCRIFGVSFTKEKVVRRYSSYSKHGVADLLVYFYNETGHPLERYGEILSDYILIRFDNIANYDGDIVSDGVLTVASVGYRKYRTPLAESYELIANAGLISLKEAEELLFKGYAFGGHYCPLCMDAQEEVSFEGYEFVGMEYYFGEEDDGSALGIPFYTFYKEIGTSQNGNKIYAKTYVSAIPLLGYDEYLESQKANHRR
ncbi:MAG: hypothetical protein IJX62_10170 [Clostridia bacterium]|nr:hypothetical protein [Clostridia bacterium]MBQ8911532.1 hypothetical protein [Clostridia bacterium]MBQ9132816.1 hypothetical protein [Clostridia bacterium]